MDWHPKECRKLHTFIRVARMVQSNGFVTDSTELAKIFSVMSLRCESRAGELRSGMSSRHGGCFCTVLLFSLRFWHLGRGSHLPIKNMLIILKIRIEQYQNSISEINFFFFFSVLQYNFSTVFSSLCQNRIFSLFLILRHHQAEVSRYNF